MRLRPILILNLRNGLSFTWISSYIIHRSWTLTSNWRTEACNVKMLYTTPTTTPDLSTSNSSVLEPIKFIVYPWSTELVWYISIILPDSGEGRGGELTFKIIYLLLLKNNAWMKNTVVSRNLKALAKKGAILDRRKYRRDRIKEVWTSIDMRILNCLEEHF